MARADQAGLLQSFLGGPEPRPAALRFGAAVAWSALALLLTLALPPVGRSSFAAFFAAVVLSGAYGGMGPALLSIALSTAAVNFFLMHPPFTMAVDINDLEQLGAFVLVGLLTSSLGEARRSAEQRARLLLAREQEARARAEQAVRVRDEVLGIVTHDLRSPLHTMGMCLELLEAPATPEERREQLEILHRSCGRMERLIQDLLDVSRLETGHLSLAVGPEKPDSIVQEACEMHRLAAASQRVHLDASAASAAPAVLADRGRVLQVLANLIGNALKFTPEGGRITVGAEPEDATMVRFTVHDTGTGVREKDLPHLFEPFWQAQRPSRQGAGLGLFIARGIVEVHGGRIWVHSEPGTGSSFFFTVPVAPAADADAREG